MHSRSSEDQIARQQSSALGQERHRPRDTKDHILRGRRLHRATIQLGRDAQRIRITNYIRRHDTGAKGGPAIEALPQTPLAGTAPELPLAVGDVVPDSIAQDIVERLRLGDIPALLAEDDDQLALVVESLVRLHERWDRDLVGRPGDRRQRLEEEHGVLGLGGAGLLCMLRVVHAQPAHRRDVLSCQRRQKRFHGCDLACYAVVAENVALDDMRRGRLGDVGDAGRQDGVTIVDTAVFGQEADETLDLCCQLECRVPGEYVKASV